MSRHSRTLVALGALLVVHTNVAKAQEPPRTDTSAAPAAETPKPANGAATATPPDAGAKQATATATTAATAEQVEELSARLNEAQQAIAQLESRQDESKIRMYGFADAGFRKVFMREASHLNHLLPDSATFLLGSLNYYLEAQPHPRVRALTELRLGLYPYGTPDRTLAPIDTSVYDMTSATGRNKVPWSGIVLERAFIEGKIFDALRVQLGYFLTPYGIWNVDHGSPTLISSSLPGFFASEYFPTRLTGLQVLGEGNVGDNVEVGYRVYLTNGRSRILIDNQDGKLIGGRGYAKMRWNSASLTVGASAFRGRLEKQSYSIAAAPSFQVKETVTVAYDEYGIGGDLSLDYGPFRLRAESVMNRTDYDPGKAEPFQIPGTFYPSRTRWDSYLLMAYRMKFLGLEPYAYVERDVNRDYFADYATTLAPGLNIHINDVCQLKNQYSFIRFNRNAATDDFMAFDTRLVVTF